MYKVNQKEMGERIKDAREKVNMTQHELYEKTGISTTQISAYENGKKSIGLQTLANIANALNVSIDELYSGSATKKPINKACNKGELITNCIVALYEAKVITALPRGRENKHVEMGMKYYYSIAFYDFVDILNDLVLKLKDFEGNINNYPNPESFKKQLIASAAKQINDKIEAEKYKIKAVGASQYF